MPLWITLSSFPGMQTHFIPPRLWNPVWAVPTLPVRKHFLLFLGYSILQRTTLSPYSSIFLGSGILQRATLSPMCRCHLHPSWSLMLCARAALVWKTSSPCWAVISDLGPLLPPAPTSDTLLTHLGLRHLGLWAPQPPPSVLKMPTCLALFNGVWSELKQKNIKFLKIKVK